MSVYRVRLGAGASAHDNVDETTATAYAAGEIDLRTAAGATEEGIAALRRQALAFHAAGRFGPCLDILLGLGALDDVSPFDAGLMAECFDALGDAEAAEVCRVMHLPVLDAIQDALTEMEAAS